SLVSTVLDFFAFAIFYYSTRTLWLSFVLARTISIIFNFHYARAWVFKVKSNFIPQLIKYLLLAITLMCISYSFTYYFSQIFEGYVILAKATAETILFILSFIIQKRYILTKDKAEIS
ncbi:MAG: GtrA family protein, partial [Deltaproteobacteria bacterium]|nr:GtrA family protein [Deltaproteobacteria bacterium]